jgi:hypothetical protein
MNNDSHSCGQYPIAKKQENKVHEKSDRSSLFLNFFLSLLGLLKQIDFVVELHF